ncbi:hypothetical protein [Granulicella sp. L60]|uniref:hypothetical protein n=1 Tax=Granulicella sp. L60 TaxID=1641866 RepID=UPI00131CAFBB|nr:hypothetical protein [Granulicella sp. L60]
MLKMSPAVRVANIPGAFNKTYDYTLFPDDEDKNIYYALADYPTYLADSHNDPSFNLTWYFGTGITSAGVCTMTVALPMPDTTNADVKSAILRELTGDKTAITIAQKTLELCKASDAKDTARVQALKTELGFNDTIVAARVSVYDKTADWTQFLPNHDSLSIRPIPFKDGTVTIQAFPSSDAYDSKDPAYTGIAKTKPSLINSNAAVVTFNLTDLGANLFWHGLGGWPLDPSLKAPEGYDAAKGGSSVISVVYSVTFDALLPEAKATVTFDQSIVAKLEVEQRKHTGSWGSQWTEEIPRSRELDEAINGNTVIVLPAVASKDDNDNVQKLLTDWAAAQMIDMAKSQLPGVDMSTLDVNSIRSLKQAKTQVRTYKLTQAVSMLKFPQAQLRKLDGIVPPDAIKKFFQLINLNDVPYVNINLTVAPPSPSFLKDRFVDRVVITDLTFADGQLLDASKKPVSSIEYLSGGDPKPGQTFTGTFAKNNPDLSTKYSYLVTYTDGTAPMNVTDVAQKNANYLSLSGVDIGVLSVSLSAIDLPWDVISSARVDLTYGTWKRTLQLNRDGGNVLVAKPFGKPITDKLTYQVTLTPTAGAPIIGEAVQVIPDHGQAEITLRNPLGNITNPIEFILDPAVTKAQLRAEYTFRNSGPDRIFSQLIQLDAAKNGGAFTWNVPSQSEKGSAFKIIRAQATTASGTNTITDPSGANADPLEQQASITVYADHVKKL